MKSILLAIFIALFTQSYSLASVTFEVDLLGEKMLISGNSSYGKVGEYFILDKVRLIDPGTGDNYYLANGLGWGSKPLNTLCDQVTQGEYPYAQSYGVVNSPSMFGPGSVMVLNPDRNNGELKNLAIFKRRQYQGLVYTQLFCSRNDWEY